VGEGDSAALSGTLDALRVSAVMAQPCNRHSARAKPCLGDAGQTTNVPIVICPSTALPDLVARLGGAAAVLKTYLSNRFRTQERSARRFCG
jgi:hypothetical protein